MLKRRAMLLILAIGWTAMGCDSSKSSGDAARVKAAREKIAAIAADKTIDTKAGASDSPIGLSQDSSAHPIDSLPEGKRFRAATRAIDRGDFETAERIRLELKQSPQYAALAVAIEAIVFVKQGKHDEAIRLAEEISAIPVMQCEAYVIAGEVFQRENRLNEAIAAFENALQIDPQHLRAHLWIGSIYYDTGAMRLATDHLRKAADLEPTEINALILSGKIFQDYEQYQDAIQDYQKAIERLDAGDIRLSVQVKLAECLSELRRMQEATEALRDCPDTASVLAVRASIAEYEGEMKKAEELARKTLEKSSINRTAGLVLGRILVAERQWTEAVTVLKGIVESYPKDHESKLLYGRAMLGAGERDAGKAAIEEATELKNVFLKFADLHQEAIKKPGDASLRVELGRMAEQLGKIELAKSWYQAAVGLEPQNGEALGALERLKIAVPNRAGDRNFSETSKDTNKNVP